MGKGDVILHPVRMRIIQSLLKRSLTVQELMEWLPDIPQATLYRQLKVLTDNNVINISKERKVRGTFERTYSLNRDSATFSTSEAHELSKEEHMKYFITYFTSLMQGVEEYLESDELDLEKDGFGYCHIDLFLDDDEFTNLKKDLVAVVKRYSDNEPNRTRRRRTVATVFIPEREK
ncbi:helix-turn-helix domain-containing protein [Alkalihalobacterium alkalinitrilicum]|uniref:helix-turn-helix domain-containing protein n=1 Tax=Alkalihalobacterium alkalinitrilicum TaxID=427920 RepID=UPI000994C7EE|nr:helix-turn-helix domain-containing protein [Alkalihalobacterium alkalinitrilicum]